MSALDLSRASHTAIMSISRSSNAAPMFPTTGSPLQILPSR
jgi:hypothetical protein